MTDSFANRIMNRGIKQMNADISHDPLCPEVQSIPDTILNACLCYFIAKVRADERARTMRDVADELVHTNRVVTLDGVIPWLRDWADHIALGDSDA